MRPPPLSVIFDVDFSEVEPADMAIGSALRAAALAAAHYVRVAWIQTAVEVGFEAGGSYVRGIESAGRVEIEEERTIGDGDDIRAFEITVAITNTAKNAAIVEDGHAAFHLPSKIDWAASGGSIKRGTHGPYLHIPFRHGAFKAQGGRDDAGSTLGARKGMMPKEIYAQARQLQRREATRQGPIHGRDGSFLAADRYRWTGLARKQRRLRHQARVGELHASSTGSVSEPRRGPRGGNPAWQGSKFGGMMKTGPAGHSSFLTIRTITPNSPGWNIPAQPGYGIAKRLAADLQHDQELRDVLMHALTSTLTG